MAWRPEGRTQENHKQGHDGDTTDIVSQAPIVGKTI